MPVASTERQSRDLQPPKRDHPHEARERKKPRETCEGPRRRTTADKITPRHAISGPAHGACSQRRRKHKKPRESLKDPRGSSARFQSSRRRNAKSPANPAKGPTARTSTRLENASPHGATERKKPRESCEGPTGLSARLEQRVSAYARDAEKKETERETPRESLGDARGFGNKPGNDLLSHARARAVPSALEGLTSEFGMGSGMAPPTSSPEKLLWS